MKKLLFCALSFLLFLSYARGQCVIATCTQTGVYSAVYNMDDTSYEHLRFGALSNCKAQEGTNCQIVFQSAALGWYAIISGRTTENKRLIEYVSGKRTEEEAKNDLIRKFKANGSVWDKSMIPKTWFVGDE